jgi:tRNA pseudouridine55 synthase
LLVDKPAGPTSHDVVAIARRAFRTKRVGHTGTLDPFATGLLTLLVGRTTRLMPFLVGLPKRYVGTLRLGESSNTDDLTGQLTDLAQGTVEVSDTELADAMRSLTGRIDQVPPLFSAKKVGGVPAHRRVRRGESVSLAPQTVEVYRFDAVRRLGSEVYFEVDVGSGTYIRALARDLGQKLGCGAHLRALRRLEVGPWHVRDAITLAALDAGAAVLKPPSAATVHFPTRPLDDAERHLVAHGRALPAREEPDGPVALLAAGALIAVAEREGDLLKPRVVLEAA